MTHRMTHGMTPSRTTAALRLPLDVRMVLLLLFGLTAAVAAGIILGPRPLLALGVVLAFGLATALMAWPNLATLTVVFVLYSNAAVVAVRFHGLPFSLGAALPLLLTVPLTYYLVVRRERLVVNRILWLFVALLVAQLIASMFSLDPARSLGRVFSFVVEGLALYFLVINVVRTPAMLRRVTWTLLGAGAFLGGLSVCQQVTRTYHNNYGGFAQMSNTAFKTGQTEVGGPVRQRRLAGPLGDQNRYAQIMLMLVPLGMFRFWGERSVGLRALALIATALIVCGMALTFSRGAAVGLVLMLAIMAVLRYLTLRQSAAILLGGLITLLALPQYATRLTTLSTLGGALRRDGDGIAAADTAIRSRYTETVVAARMFADHPLTGVGPGMYAVHYEDRARSMGRQVKEGGRQPHTLYLGMAAELGAPGLIVFLAIALVTLRGLAQTRRRCGRNDPDVANLATGYMLAIVTYLTTGLFLHFAYERFFWLILALAGAVTCVAGAAASAPARVRSAE